MSARTTFKSDSGVVAAVATLSWLELAQAVNNTAAARRARWGLCMPAILSLPGACETFNSRTAPTVTAQQIQAVHIVWLG